MPGHQTCQAGTTFFELFLGDLHVLTWGFAVIAGKKLWFSFHGESIRPLETDSSKCTKKKGRSLGTFGHYHSVKILSTSVITGRLWLQRRFLPGTWPWGPHWSNVVDVFLGYLSLTVELTLKWKSWQDNCWVSLAWHVYQFVGLQVESPSFYARGWFGLWAVDYLYKRFVVSAEHEFLST